MNNERHVSAGELAAYIDGTMGQIDSARIEVHLDRCDGCRGAWKHAAGAGLGNNADGESSESPDGRATRAARLVAAERWRRGHFDRRGKRRWVVGVGTAGRVVLALAVVALFALVTWCIRPVAG